MGGWAARKALRVVEHVEQGDVSLILADNQSVSAVAHWLMSLSCSAGHRAAGCLPGFGVPAPPEDHHSSGEGLRAAALRGQVRHTSVEIDLKVYFMHIFMCLITAVTD